MTVPSGGFRFMGSPKGDSLHVACECGEPGGVVGRSREGAAIWRCSCGRAWVQEGAAKGILISPDGSRMVGVTII